MVFLLALLESKRKTEHDADKFKESYDLYSRQNLGRMIKALKKEANLSEVDAAFMLEGIKKRNRVIHGFMTDNTEMLINPKDRLKLIANLQKIRDEIKKVDAFLNKLIDKLLRIYNVTVEDFKKQADKYFDFVNYTFYTTKH